jgi:Fe-S cluster assembly protein SufD
MTAALPSGAAWFLARYDAERGRLPGDAAVRAAAAEAFRQFGLPGATRGRRPEAWKYTELRPLADRRFETATPPAVSLARVPTIDAPRVVFVDGVYRAELSTPPASFRRFADAPRFAAAATRDPLAALNTMLAEDVSGNAGIVHLVSAGTDNAAFHPRHRIRLAAGAMLTLVETCVGEGTYLHNPVMEVEVATGARLTHLRLQDEAVAAFHLSTVYATVDGDGTYDSFTLALGSRIARNEVHALLSAPGAIAHLNGAQLLAGNQHADFTTVVRHAAPNGSSRQTVKNVLAGRARGVFQGRIEVAREAQKTDGYQMNQALLLSPDAEIDTKPELEIFADDVKCSHGATVGELDADQLFYLRSRGIPDAEARSILVRAFLSEALDVVADETLRAMLDTKVGEWWERQAV